MTVTEFNSDTALTSGPTEKETIVKTWCNRFHFWSNAVFRFQVVLAFGRYRKLQLPSQDRRICLIWFCSGDMTRHSITDYSHFQDCCQLGDPYVKGSPGRHLWSVVIQKYKPIAGFAPEKSYINLQGLISIPRSIQRTFCQTHQDLCGCPT